MNTPRPQQTSQQTAMFGWHEQMQALVFMSDRGPVAIHVKDLSRHPHGWTVSADNFRRCLPRVDPPVIEQAPAGALATLNGFGRGGPSRRRG